MNKTLNTTTPINPTHPPPAEAVCIALSVLSCCLWRLPKIFHDIDSVATVEVISTPLFEDAMSKYTLAYIRLGIAGLFLATTIYRWNKKG